MTCSLNCDRMDCQVCTQLRLTPFRFTSQKRERVTRAEFVRKLLAQTRVPERLHKA